MHFSERRGLLGALALDGESLEGRKLNVSVSDHSTDVQSAAAEGDSADVADVASGASGEEEAEEEEEREEEEAGMSALDSKRIADFLKGSVSARPSNGTADTVTAQESASAGKKKGARAKGRRGVKRKG